MSTDTDKRITEELDNAEQRALESLAGYKFVMFGYWAGVWVHLNRVGRCRRANPFHDLVHLARDLKWTKQNNPTLLRCGKV